MKVPDGLPFPESSNSKPRSAFSIKLKRSLYGLKQSGRMWNTRLSTLDEIREIASYLKSEFEMKDLGKTRFCLGLELENRPCGILIDQSAYVHKIFRQFNMDKVHPASTPMIGRSLDVRNDPFRTKEDGEEVLGAEIPYLSAIGALLYLKGTIDMGLFYPYEDERKIAKATPYTETPNNILVGFADAGSITTHIRGTSGLNYTTEEPTCIYEDNAACIEQMKQGYIKGDNTKHISPKFFYNQQQQCLLNIQINKVPSDENMADLFTKSLPKSLFEKHVKSIGLRKLYELP
ncbi:uncharacterized protein LOC113316309 [Papaver somniferum]|uniref:uncharacterized protein LOC113316309 n=1 Tax=Papaver somniferum TaxID=3469 RepID=UPI000E6FF872|nr:uncharacterized protein LOC113316309 [Papaver somniferum]